MIFFASLQDNELSYTEKSDALPFKWMLLLATVRYTVTWNSGSVTITSTVNRAYESNRTVRYD